MGKVSTLIFSDVILCPNPRKHSVPSLWKATRYACSNPGLVSQRKRKGGRVYTYHTFVFVDGSLLRKDEEGSMRRIRRRGCWEKMKWDMSVLENAKERVLSVNLFVYHTLWCPEMSEIPDGLRAKGLGMNFRDDELLNANAKNSLLHDHPPQNVSQRMILFIKTKRTSRIIFRMSIELMQTSEEVSAHVYVVPPASDIRFGRQRRLGKEGGRRTMMIFSNSGLFIGKICFGSKRGFDDEEAEEDDMMRKEGVRIEMGL